MQPNLEIRERVAREVMGQTVGRVKLDPSADQDDDYAPYVNDATGQPLRGLMYHEGMLVVGRARLPAYEVDIAAAFQVVERWCSVKSELGHANGKNRVNIEIDGVTARVGFCVEIEVEVGYAEHQSLPMAICLAALAAYRATQTKEPRDDE